MKEKEIESLIDEMYPMVAHGKFADVQLRGGIRFGARKVLNEYIKRTTPVLLPLRQLSEDREMCEEIARLCNPRSTIVKINAFDYCVSIVMLDYELVIHKNGVLEYSDDFGNQTPDNTFAVCQKISSKYKIEQ